MVLSTLSGLGSSSVLFKSNVYFIPSATVVVPTTQNCLSPHPPKKETFCPSAHDSGQGVFSGNLPSLHTGDINMKLVVAERGWKWLSAIIYSDIELAQAWSIQSSLRKKKLLDISWSHGRLTFIFKSAWSKSKESRVQHSYRSTGENTKFTLHIVFIPGLPEVSACLQWAHISI